GQVSSDTCPFLMSVPRILAYFVFLCGALVPLCSHAQTKVPPPDNSQSLKKGMDLARSGHCREALPLLRKQSGQVEDKSLKRDAGLAGVRCALFSNQPDAALDFLRALNRDFPRDPEVLYITVHAYSDLSTR